METVKRGLADGTIGEDGVSNGAKRKAGKGQKSVGVAAKTRACKVARTLHMIQPIGY